MLFLKWYKLLLKYELPIKLRDRDIISTVELNALLYTFFFKLENDWKQAESSCIF